MYSSTAGRSGVECRIEPVQSLIEVHSFGDEMGTKEGGNGTLGSLIELECYAGEDEEGLKRYRYYSLDE